MKQNDDGKKVRPWTYYSQVGEIIGGSQREENYDKLYGELKNLNSLKKTFVYLETRKFGSAPHSGLDLVLNDSCYLSLA